MGRDFALARVMESGRVVLPDWQRRVLDLREGDTVVIDLHAGGLRIRRVNAILSELQAKVRRLIPDARNGVEDLLEMRRQEVAREEEKYGHLG